jgi:hypothetical protein
MDAKSRVSSWQVDNDGQAAFRFAAHNLRGPKVFDNAHRVTAGDIR